ncbi:DUF58 domain-containing protein [Pseudonocardia petroleophila]|uniref:DUF58 domain-containing protein n=1 Tax=Pseudonocardia petroleophila TaxID=37331 RepID=A0A7G7MG95_9PSEU|nr:DUF58 domain-containing protein [Pseudonocardia petroleophila]QNG51806.1 DUF58 domain-containing protein [Pseudonocardia petroleophila]
MRLAGLTTRGRCLLAAGAATAVSAFVLDERDLLRVGAFVALLPLLALLVSVFTRRSVRGAREVSPERVPAGGEVAVAITLRGGPLVGALRLVDAVPDASGPQPSAPPRFTVHRLSPRAGAQLSYPLVPAQRGVHRIGPLTGGSTDPLGLAEFERELAPASRLVALPRVVALRGMPQALGSGEGTPGAALAHQGQGRSDVLVRQYRQGDELRRVHWRSTARHDELMVRLEERPWRTGTTVLLDRRDAAHRGHGPDSSLEVAISLAASICTHLGGRGEVITLVTEDGAELGTASGDIDPLLDTLAALRPAARTDLAGPELAGDVLAVLGALGAGDLESLVARQPAGGHAVLLDVAGWEPAGRGPDVAAAATALRRAGWRVAVARAGVAPDRAWDELVAQSIGSTS